MSPISLVLHRPRAGCFFRAPLPQYGKTNFFLWEIAPIFFYHRVFISWQPIKTFLGLWGSKKTTLKMLFFGDFSRKIKFSNVLNKCFLVQLVKNLIEVNLKQFSEKILDQNSQTGCQNPLKTQFFNKKKQQHSATKKLYKAKIRVPDVSNMA